MKNKQGKQDYDAFMQWFSSHYPELYKQHQETIILPSNGEGVTVDKDKMDGQTYQKMIDITREYYRLENR